MKVLAAAYSTDKYGRSATVDMFLHTLNKQTTKIECLQTLQTKFSLHPY